LSSSIGEGGKKRVVNLGEKDKTREPEATPGKLKEKFRKKERESDWDQGAT